MSRNIPRNKKKSYGNDDDEVHSTEKEFMKGDPTLRSDHSSVEGGILLKKSDSNVNTNSGFGSSGNDDKSLTSKRKAPSTKSKTVAIIEKLNKKKETEKRAYSKNSIFGARMKQADREEFDDLGDIPDHGGASGRDKSGKFEEESHRNPGNQDQESIDKFLKMRALKKLQHTKKELRIKGIIKSNKTAPKRSKTIRKSKKDEAGDNGLVEETKHPDVTVNNLMNMETIPAMNEDKEDDQVVIQETNKKWMFRYSDPILNQWDTFIIAIAIYNCFTLSFNIGFDPSFAKHPAYITLDVILIIIYILDILQSYITTYLDKDGEEVWDRKKIAKNYIYSGKFGIDVLSTIPFDYFGGPELLAMLGLLKLTRLGRISVIISRLNVNEQLKALIKMAQLTFYLFVVIHIVGCIWFWLVKQNDEWIPPHDFIVLPPGTDLYNKSITYHYWSAIYNAIIMLASNELGPRTPAEYLFVSVMMIVGALIMANIFGEMAVLAQVMTKKQVKFQEQIDTANTAMKNLVIGPEVQQEVRNYFLFTQVTLDEQQELEKFLELLSPSLKLEVTIHIFAKLMKKKLFSNQHSKVDQTIRMLVSKLETVLSVPEAIFRQDDDSNDMYFIAKGECEVSVRDYKRRDHEKIRTLRPGDHFGEISLIYGCRRTATVTSRNYSTLGKISKEVFLQIQSDNPGFIKHLKKYMNEYNDPNQKFISAAMRKVEFCKGISDIAFVEIMHNFEKTNYKTGYQLFKEDQNIDSFSIVYEGIVEFYTYFERGEFILERLYPGSLYNFRTFFMEDLMYVNARCETNVTLLQITNSKMQEIMENHDDVKRKMLSYQNQILKYGISFPLDYLVNIPKEFRKDKIFSEAALKRDNAFKNAIMRRIIEIRIEKQKPKLSDLLKMFEGKDLSNPKDKEALRKKLYDLYEGGDAKDKNSKYHILITYFERINKVLSYQQAAFNKIDRRITKLQNDITRTKNK